MASVAPLPAPVQCGYRLWLLAMAGGHVPGRRCGGASWSSDTLPVPCCRGRRERPAGAPPDTRSAPPPTADDERSFADPRDYAGGTAVLGLGARARSLCGCGV